MGVRIKKCLYTRLFSFQSLRSDWLSSLCILPPTIFWHSLLKLLLQADTSDSRNGDRWVRKREQRKHTLTIVGSHLLFVNSDMWPPIMTFKLGEARTKQTQMLWSPWVGDEQVL